MKTKVFKNGLVLLYEKNNVNNTDSFQVNVLTGSALETKKEYGINHLVEHLMFKASNKRTTREIAEELEKQGAVINAWTNYDNVRFYFDCLPEKLDKCAEVYADMLFNKNISDSEFATEKNVVCQEIKMYEDNFAAKNETNYFEYFWNMKDIAGTVESVQALTKKQVMNFIKVRYVPANMIISVCSRLSFRKVQTIVKKYFNLNNPEKYLDLRKQWDKSFKHVHAGEISKKKEKTAQVQVLHVGRLNMDVSPVLQDYYLKLISGGLSSVLFKEIREKHGLCYGIAADSMIFYPTSLNKNQGGLVFIQSSMEKKNLKKYLELLPEVIKKLDTLLQDSDIERTVNAYKTRGSKSSYVASDMFFRYLNPQIHYYKNNFAKECKYIFKHKDKFAVNAIKDLKDITWDVSILGNL